MVSTSSNSQTKTGAHRGVIAAVITLALVAAAACGSSDGAATGDRPNGEPAIPAGNVVVADVDRLVPDEDAARDAGVAVSSFGFDLYGAARDQPGNLAISPYSVAVALSMTRAGADGQTADEMDAVLHLQPIDDIHAAFGSLDGVLATRPGDFPTPEGDPLRLELSFGNALWPQTGFSFEQSFLDLLGMHYGAGINVVDYANDAEGARSVINDWVADRTVDRIPELIAAGVLGAQTRLVLTNAVYLNAPWLYPFDEGRTQDASFQQLDSATLSVPFMALDESLKYAAGDGWQAVQLPYVGSDLSMVIAVPDAGRFGEFGDALDADLAGAVRDAATSTPVALRLPSWEYRTQIVLNDQLRELGMPTAFTPTADFSAMSQEPLFISDVLHEVFVSVDEQGTEAAAATAVIMVESAAPAAPIELTVDRPFVYWIVDDATGAVLFLGRVMDLTAT